MTHRPEPTHVRPMREQDLRQSAAIHHGELDDSFFARLGPRFLQAYHRTYVTSPHAVALVVVTGGRVQGFLVGVLAPTAHGAYVLRTWGVRLAVVGGMALLVRPRELVLFLRTRLGRYARGLWRRRRGAAGTSAPAQGGTSAPAQAGISPPAQPETSAVLSHLAVCRSAQGSGAGAALVARFAQEVRAASVSSIVLLTAVDGPGAGFYRRLGYTEQGNVVGGDGQTWLRFRQQLDTDGRSGGA